MIGDGADAHDVAVSPLEHRGEEAAHKTKGGDDVYLERRGERIGRRCIDGGRTEEARIVHEDIG